MCCTLEPAHLFGTILYAAETVVNDKIVHVMGYQNDAENLSRGPNAMILPIPAANLLGPDNMLDTSMAKSILKDLGDAVKPRTLSRGFSLGTKGVDALSVVQVFDKGSYTVVLATNARAIPAALEQVPLTRRPKPNPAIFDAYAQWYPEWPIALCCWDGSIKAEPLLWHYEPQDQSRLFAPALDGHDGKLPQIGRPVSVDHIVAFGSVMSPRGQNVYYQDFNRWNEGKRGMEAVIPEHLRPFLAHKVTGQSVHDMQLPNGDFSLPIGLIEKPWKVERVVPPGAA